MTHSHAMPAYRQPENSRPAPGFHKKFSDIPHEVYADKRLKDADIRVLGILTFFADDRNATIIGNERIAERAGKCRRSVRESLRRLHECGYIVRIKDMSATTQRRVYLTWREKGSRVASGTRRRADGSLDDLARTLGFTNYADYRNSDLWKQFKDRFFAENFKRCLSCGGHDRVCLHHITYERLGRELHDDVRPLCLPCHTAIHVAHAKNDIPMSKFDLAFPLIPQYRGQRIGRGMKIKKEATLEPQTPGSPCSLASQPQTCP